MWKFYSLVIQLINFYLKLNLIEIEFVGTRNIQTMIFLVLLNLSAAAEHLNISSMSIIHFIIFILQMFTFLYLTSYFVVYFTFNCVYSTLITFYFWIYNFVNLLFHCVVNNSSISIRWLKWWSIMPIPEQVLLQVQ